MSDNFQDFIRAPDAIQRAPVFPSTLLPTKQELDMYQSDGNIRKSETGEGIGFHYRVSLSEGCRNAALWKDNCFTRH